MLLVTTPQPPSVMLKTRLIAGPNSEFWIVTLLDPVTTGTGHLTFWIVTSSTKQRVPIPSLPSIPSMVMCFGPSEPEVSPSSRSPLTNADWPAASLNTTSVEDVLDASYVILWT